MLKATLVDLGELPSRGYTITAGGDAAQYRSSSLSGTDRGRAAFGHLTDTSRVNLIDVGIVVLLAFGLIAGWRSGFFPQLLGLAGAAAGGVLVVLALPYLHDLLDGVDPTLRAITVLVALLAAIGIGEAIGSSIGAAHRPSARRRRAQRPRPAGRGDSAGFAPGAARRLARGRAPRGRAGAADGRPGPAVVHHPDDQRATSRRRRTTSTSSRRGSTRPACPRCSSGSSRSRRPRSIRPTDEQADRIAEAAAARARSSSGRRPAVASRPGRPSSWVRVATLSRTRTSWPEPRPSWSRSTATARATRRSSCSIPSSTSPCSVPRRSRRPHSPLPRAIPREGPLAPRSAIPVGRRFGSSRRRSPTATPPRVATCTAPIASPDGSSSCAPTSSAATAAARSSCPTGRSAASSMPRR